MNVSITTLNTSAMRMPKHVSVQNILTLYGDSKSFGGCEESTCVPYKSKLLARLRGSRPFHTICVEGIEGFDEVSSFEIQVP